MRSRPSWMNPASLPILSLLSQTGYAFPVEVIHYNLATYEGVDVSRHEVLRALGELEARELVQIADGSQTYYELSEDGRQYLAGELGAADLANQQK